MTVGARSLSHETGELFHNQKEACSHYDKVLQTKAPLYYERFDSDILDKRPLVRDLVAGTFAKLFPEKATDLLDVGCGTGFYFPLLTEHAENVTGIDVCAPMLEEARGLIKQKGLANCGVRECSVLNLPFEDNTMDVVHSWDFLHHVPDVPRAISEISRVLRPGGRYVALEPNILNPSITWYHLRGRSEWRLFLQNQFRIPHASSSTYASSGSPCCLPRTVCNDSSTGPGRTERGVPECHGLAVAGDCTGNIVVLLHLLRPKGLHLDPLAFGQFLGDKLDRRGWAKMNVERLALGTFHEKMGCQETAAAREGTSEMRYRVSLDS